MNWLDKLERKFGRYAIHNLCITSSFCMRWDLYFR